MLGVSPVRVAVPVPAPTEVHAAPAWLPLYHQAALWPVRVSVAPVGVMPDAVRAVATTRIVIQSGWLAPLPPCSFTSGIGLRISLKWRVAGVVGAVNEGVAVVAPDSVTLRGSLARTLPFELAPPTWVHCQVTLSPHGPVAVPDRSTVAPPDTDRSAPAFAVGLNGAPVLPQSPRVVSDLSASKTSSGSEAKSLPHRRSVVSDPSSSKMPTGNESRLFSSRNSHSSAVSSSKMSAGNEPRLLFRFKPSLVSAASSSKTPAGNDVKSVYHTVRFVSAASSSKTPAGNVVRL